MQRLSRVSPLFKQSSYVLKGNNRHFSTAKPFSTPTAKVKPQIIQQQKTTGIVRHTWLCITRQGNHYHLTKAIKTGDFPLARTIVAKEKSDKSDEIRGWLPYYTRFLDKHLRGREKRAAQLSFVQDADLAYRRVGVSVLTMYPWIKYVTFLYNNPMMMLITKHSYLFECLILVGVPASLCLYLYRGFLTATSVKENAIKIQQIRKIKEVLKPEFLTA